MGAVGRNERCECGAAGRPSAAAVPNGGPSEADLARAFFAGQVRPATRDRRDGRHHFDGVDHRVAITEPDKNNVIHGLLLWRPRQVLRQERTRVTMGARLFPMQGYRYRSVSSDSGRRFGC